MALGASEKQRFCRNSRLLSVIGVFFSVAILAPAQTPGDTGGTSLDHDFQAAMEARDNGDLEHAKQILSALHRNHPGLFAVDESLGLVYVTQEDYGAALPLLQAAVREEPSSDAAHANLGAALFKLKREPEALKEFEAAQHLNPKNAATQQGLGELWLRAGKSEKAVEAFSAALRLMPDDKNLQMDCATAMVAAGRLAEAIEILSKIPDAEQSADAQSLLGEIDEKQGQFKEAVTHLSRAADLDPSEANLWALAVEFLRHWTFDAAATEFEAAVQRFPNSTRMKLGLGAAYFGGARYAEAIPVFAGLLKSDRDNALYAEMLGMACTAVSNSAKQNCSALVDYAENHPRDAWASTYAASMLLTDTADIDETKKAGKLLANAALADPKLADAQYQLGLLKQNQGDWTGSVSNLEAAIRLKPDFSQAHYRLALAYWRTGRKQEGQAEMELQKKFSKQEKEDLDKRLRQVTTFIVEVRQ